MATVITTIAGTDVISTSRTTINSNFSSILAEKIELDYLSTDTTLAANSDTKIATQKAVKAYVDAGGNVNASETTKGIVEEASDAEVTAGTATGATGAKLFVTPAKLATNRLSPSTVPVVRTYLNAVSPATWTKPSGLKYVIVEVQGAGGNGANSDGSVSGGGGGSGGYTNKIIAVASLGVTETLAIGAAGVGSGATSFGILLVCNNGGNASTSTGGSAGTVSTAGDFSLTGVAGGSV